MDNEQLKERLRFQGGPGSLDNNRKRASDESDDMSGNAPKRLSKLQEKNKMLASLLAGPSRPLNSSSISTLSNLPVVRQMPDIPNANQTKHLDGQQQQASTPNNQNIPNNNNKGSGSMNNNNNTVTKNHNIKSGQNRVVRQAHLARQQSMPGGKNLKQMNESVYMSQMQQHQQQQQQIVMSRVLTSSASSFDGSSSNDGSQQFVSSSPAITLAAASSSSSTIQSDSVIDPELNDILDNLFDEGTYNEDPMMNLIQNNNSNASNSVNTNMMNSQLKQQQEELAQINKIQQSLMECEEEANFSGSPPAYQMHVAISAAQQQSRLQPNFTQPPPGYNQRNIRLPQMSVTSNNSNNNALNNNASSNNLVTNSNAAAIAQATNSQKIPNPAQIERYRLQQQVILEQKQRLLQQQQNQQIVVTAGADQLCKLTWYFAKNSTVFNEKSL